MMHLCKKRWLDSKSTRRFGDRYQGQSSIVFDQNIDKSSAADTIADFNYQATEMEKKFRYSTWPKVKIFHALKEGFTRFSRFKKSRKENRGKIQLNFSDDGFEMRDAKVVLPSLPAKKLIK